LDINSGETQGITDIFSIFCDFVDQLLQQLAIMPRAKSGWVTAWGSVSGLIISFSFILLCSAAPIEMFAWLANDGAICGFCSPSSTS
jgi:hypothetical protein